MLLRSDFARGIRSLAPALLAAAFIGAVACGDAPAQTVVGTVTNVGRGCAGVMISATPPIATNLFAFRISTGVPAPVIWEAVASIPVAPIPFINGCTVYVDPATYLSLGQFPTDAAGNYVAVYALPNYGNLLGLTARLQAVAFSAALPGGFGLTNGIEVRVGNVLPYVSESNSGFAPGGTSSAVVIASFASVFATAGYLEIGVYSPPTGARRPTESGSPPTRSASRPSRATSAAAEPSERSDPTPSIRPGPAAASEAARSARK